MEKTLPETVKAVVLHRSEQPIRVEQIPLPVPKSGQVLIKVEAAPINPSDVLLTKGVYPAGKDFPVAGGLEGSGTVVDAGDEASKAQIGKRVAFFAAGNNGTWSEYSIANASQIFELDPDVDFKIGASSFVNPLTVIGMLDVTIKEGHKAVVHNAGSSALGKMMTRLFHKNNIPVISVVRKQEQIGQLKEELGQDVLVFNSTSETFLHDLKQAVAEKQATGFFDAVGGRQAGQILQVLPPKSVCYNYGLLSGESLADIDANSLIFSQKVVKGFWLSAYMQSLTPEGYVEFIGKLRTFFKEFLTSKVYKTYSYDDIFEALKDYEQNSSQGKIILAPRV